MVESSSQPNVIVIRFANEPRQRAPNIKAYVRAVLIYSEGQRELCDLAGYWLDDGNDEAAFEADGRRHTLIAGILVDGELVAITKREIAKWNRRFFVAELHPLRDLQAGTVFVRLIDASTREPLYEGQFGVSVNPLRIVPESSL